MRETILDEIRRLAALNNQQPPGQALFKRETGIGEHSWRGKFWARWGDALIDAGFQPNNWTARLDPGALLDGYIVACRHYGRMPTYSELTMLRRTVPAIPSPKTLNEHFRKRPELVAALVKHVADDDTLGDIAAMLPELTPQEATPMTARASQAEGHVYLIKSGAFYKIGRSDDLERRVKEIRIALPDKATLEHSIRTDDPPGIEAYWHQRFKDRRANGEWFKLTSLDVSAWPAAGLVDTEIGCFHLSEVHNAKKEVQPRVQA